MGEIHGEQISVRCIYFILFFFVVLQKTLKLQKYMHQIVKGSSVENNIIIIIETIASTAFQVSWF